MEAGKLWVFDSKHSIRWRLEGIHSLLRRTNFGPCARMVISNWSPFDTYFRFISSIIQLVPSKYLIPIRRSFTLMAIEWINDVLALETSARSVYLGDRVRRPNEIAVFHSFFGPPPPTKSEITNRWPTAMFFYSSETSSTVFLSLFFVVVLEMFERGIGVWMAACIHAWKQTSMKSLVMITSCVLCHSNVISVITISFIGKVCYRSITYEM